MKACFLECCSNLFSKKLKKTSRRLLDLSDHYNYVISIKNALLPFRKYTSKKLCLSRKTHVCVRDAKYSNYTLFYSLEICIICENLEIWVHSVNAEKLLTIRYF